ncbi:DUF6197 family protein [Micromonospora endophytica]|uniref:Uncharacterized protein n=1 Tax=Micromonospora endophytica TaxID=515350 RepID=A0A2W2C347_9ACTN|nr:hypothetical protein [Micromonospora endophytica]PZF92270.1 hypothetical protein C1I93_19720 [Micromonospora endophytica]RIW49216.1 hypothetical protein D3H59_05670 [Micromonospora endophytica]BCJ59007.1 hypothetical protein Jiend_24290 [Micromonospora endophytica]
MQATHQPTVTGTVTPADLLRLAALYLRRHGWTRGTYYAITGITTPTPPACVVGAIGIACAGRRINHPEQLDGLDRQTYRHAVAALVDYLDAFQPVRFVDDDGFPVIEHSSPYAWNDDPGRTAEQVVTTLEKAADDWDSLHTDGGEN